MSCSRHTVYFNMKTAAVVLVFSCMLSAQEIPAPEYFKYLSAFSNRGLLYVKVSEDKRFEYLLFDTYDLKIFVYDRHYKAVIPNFIDFLYLVWSEQLLIPAAYFGNLPSEGRIRIGYKFRYRDKNIAEIIKNFASKGKSDGSYILSQKLREDFQMELLYYFTKNFYVVFWDDAGARWVVWKTW